jgi:hypothetical protein
MYLRWNSQVTAHYTLAEQWVIRVFFPAVLLVLSLFQMNSMKPITEQNCINRRDTNYILLNLMFLSISALNRSRLLEVLLRYSSVRVLDPLEDTPVEPRYFSCLVL